MLEIYLKTSGTKYKAPAITIHLTLLVAIKIAVSIKSKAKIIFL
jgi:hypothetical protein